MEYIKKEVNTVKELGEVFGFLAKTVKAVRKASKDGMQPADLVTVVTEVMGDMANAIAGADKIKEEMNKDVGAFIMTGLIGAGEIMSAFKEEV